MPRRVVVRKKDQTTLMSEFHESLCAGQRGGVVTNRKVLENNDARCFVDEGGGPTYPEESLPILLKGRIPLATSKEKDMDATSSSGEKTRPNDADVGIPQESLGRT